MLGGMGKIFVPKAFLGDFERATRCDQRMQAAEGAASQYGHAASRRKSRDLKRFGLEPGTPKHLTG